MRNPKKNRKCRVVNCAPRFFDENLCREKKCCAFENAKKLTSAQLVCQPVKGPILGSNKDSTINKQKVKFRPKFATFLIS